MRTRSLSLVLTLVLAVLVATHTPTQNRSRLKTENPEMSPPEHAAASIVRGAGSCVRFLSVYVPAQGGHYVVGVSFAFWDRDHDGQYTPGIDKMKACVNCPDICGFGP